MATSARELPVSSRVVRDAAGRRRDLGVRNPRTYRCRGRMSALHAAADRALREQLKSLGDRLGGGVPRSEHPGAVRRWYAQDGLALERKVRTSIVEGTGHVLTVRRRRGAGARRTPRDTGSHGGGNERTR